MKNIIERIQSGETRNLPFGKYEWRVLVKEEGRALLVTEDVIEMRPYHDRFKAVTWKDCSLRKYLNTKFLEEFSIKEQAMILKSTIENPVKPKYGKKGWNITYDKVFLLSIEEAKWYFESDEGRAAKHDGEAAWWWLRSPGRNSYYAAYVDRNGDAVGIGYYVHIEIGVRPALLFNLFS